MQGIDEKEFINGNLDKNDDFFAQYELYEMSHATSHRLKCNICSIIQLAYCLFV